MRSFRIGPWVVALMVVGVACAVAQPLKPCDLMKMMLSKDEATARRGIDGFVRMGEMATMPLVCFVSGKAPGCPAPPNRGKMRGETALVKMGRVAMPAILERINTTDDEFRTRLVRVLGQIKDIRRDKPLLRLWGTEKTDRVRSALPAAIVSVKKPAAALPMLRNRVMEAGPRELQALMVQFALYGTDDDLASVMARVPSKRTVQFIRKVTQDLKQIRTDAAKAALLRLQSLDRGDPDA